MNNRRGKKVQESQTFKGPESPVAQLQQLLLRVCCGSDAMTTMRTHLREQGKRRQEEKGREMQMTTYIAKTMRNLIEATPE
jgi:hypothetical protein